MNKNIILIGLIVGIILISGCIQQEKSTFESDVKQETSTKIPESPNKLETSGAPAPPADQALAEVTILSQNNDQWKIRVDKIRDYIRYPNAKNLELKEGEEVSVYVNGFLDTFEFRGPTCPPGYVKSPKPAGAQSETGEPSTRPIQKIVVGGRYLSKLFGCFAEANCQPIGWAGWLYNPSSTIIEYECVKQSTTPTVVPPGYDPDRIEVNYRAGTDVSDPISLLPSNLRNDVKSVGPLVSAGWPEYRWIRFVLNTAADEGVFMTKIRALEWVEIAEFAPLPAPPPTPQPQR